MLESTTDYRRSLRFSLLRSSFRHSGSRIGDSRSPIKNLEPYQGLNKPYWELGVLLGTHGALSETQGALLGTQGAL